MSRGGWQSGWLAAALALLLGACGGQSLATSAPVHGSLVVRNEVVRRGIEPAPRAVPPLVVLIERHRVRAVDPKRARTLWTVPVEVVAHPVASEHTVYLPVAGQRILAVDRRTGQTRFSYDLPGEAVTGLGVSEPWLVAVVLDPRDQHRSRIVGISTVDGRRGWQRPSAGRLGIPDVRGSTVVVPLGHQAVALDLSRGREQARVDLAKSDRGSFERVVHHGDGWVAGADTAWIELDQGPVAPRIHRLNRTYAPAFVTVEGIDGGHGEADRLRLWTRMSGVDATPRDGILLARRAVVALRLDPDGRPVRARWVHREAKGEFVAMEVSKHQVTLVREDGGIVGLDLHSGAVTDRIAGGEPVRGALILRSADVDRVEPDQAQQPGVAAQLYGLLLDPDPRLLPAQRLAADLLWRDDHAEVRQAVIALGAGRLRPEGTEVSERLRRHALDLASSSWGQGASADVFAVLAALRRRPEFGPDQDLQLSVAARAARRTGTPEVVDELTALLLHPGTAAQDMVEILHTLTVLRDPRAVAAVATFLRRYHADGVVAYESSALGLAAALLLEYAKADLGAASRAAREALHEVVADPLCERDLRGFIATGLAALPRAEEPSESASQVLSASL